MPVAPVADWKKQLEGAIQQSQASHDIWPNLGGPGAPAITSGVYFAAPVSGSTTYAANSIVTNTGGRA